MCIRDRFLFRVFSRVVQLTSGEKEGRRGGEVGRSLMSSDSAGLCVRLVGWSSWRYVCRKAIADEFGSKEIAQSESTEAKRCVVDGFQFN